MQVVYEFFPLTFTSLAGTKLGLDDRNLLLELLGQVWEGLGPLGPDGCGRCYGCDFTPSPPQDSPTTMDSISEPYSMMTWNLLTIVMASMRLEGTKVMVLSPSILRTMLKCKGECHAINTKCMGLMHTCTIGGAKLRGCYYSCILLEDVMPLVRGQSIHLPFVGESILTCCRSAFVP